jgi:hypothetical protein
MSATVEKEVVREEVNVEVFEEDPPPPQNPASTPPPPPFSERTLPTEEVAASLAATKKRGKPPLAAKPVTVADFNSALWAEKCMRALRYADDPAEVPKIEAELINPHLSEASPADIEEVQIVLAEVKIAAGLA